MDAHLKQAQRLGVNVLWWTDHDFRVAALGYREAVRFDGAEELENGAAWVWLPLTTGEFTSARHDFVSAPHSPDEGGGALRIAATAGVGPLWATYLLEGQAWNFTYSTSYADTVLELDVLAESVGANAQVVVEIGSSYRPETDRRLAGQYRLQYRIGAPRGRWTADGGRLGVVGIPTESGWQRITMDLRADHAALWPDTVANDASLKQFRVGVRARSGATAQAVVDRLRFLRRRRSVADGMALLRAAVSEYRGRYPGLTQYAASEISLVNHLNAFGGDGTLPAYKTTQPIKNESLAAQRAMTTFLHEHGALVSINHPRPGADLASTLVTTRGVGADVIEIGTGAQVESLARAFDVAARNAVFLTANGVTDDHEGVDWLDPTQPRWITGTWAESRGSGDLCAAMSAGRAWFYDPLRWVGELDLLVDGHVPMGGVLLTRHRRVPLQVTATSLPTGGALELVIGQCDRAGADQLQPLNSVRAVPATSVVSGRWNTDIIRGAGVFVRVMVRARNGAVAGFSNPVWILPAHLTGEIPVPANRRFRD
jgi:hypothetical protein